MRLHQLPPLVIGPFGVGMLVLQRAPAARPAKFLQVPQPEVVCRTSWKLKEIEKAQDGTYELYYDTPDGSQKVSLLLATLATARRHTTPPTSRDGAHAAPKATCDNL